MHQSTDDIFKTVQAEYGVTRAQLMAPTRSSAKVALARQEAMRRVRAAQPNWSWSEIGRLFGRDRTTVRHACKKAINVQPAAAI